MKTKKPLVIGLAIGLLALAFTALPAMASANATIRNASTNKALAVGAPINAVSTGANALITETVAGNLECETTELNGEVTANGGLEAEVGNITGTATGGGAEGTDCASNNPEITGVTVTVNKVGPIKFTGAGTDTAPAEFTAVLKPSGAVCVFKGTVNTTFTLGASPLVDTVTPSTLTASGATCPIAGTSATISGKFVLTSAGVQLKITNP